MSRAACLSLIFFGLLAYFNAIRHPFVHDDVIFILNDPHITGLDHWLEAFKAPVVSDGLNTYYRPVLEVIYRLEYHFFGPNPFGYHLVNCLLHIINGLLLFGLLQKLGLAKHIAWVIALLFLVHPVQTEAVSCIAGISNLFMALCVLLALKAYLDKHYSICTALFVIACLAKEQGILFVPLVMVIDYSRGQKNVRSWIFLGIVTIVLLFLRQCMTGASLFKDITASPGELYLRLAAVPRDILMYLRLIFCPYDLHYYRSTDILQSNKLAWGTALIGIAGSFYALRRWPQARFLMVLGFGWFLAALLPVLNVVPLINEYSFILTPEHFLYLPMIGILIMVVSAADHFLDHFKALILGVVVAACLILTWYQNTYWRSEVALFERMVQFEPNFGRGQLLLAEAYYFKGQPGRAEGHFQKAFTIMSVYENKAVNSTSKRFYLKYMNKILYDWAQNESAMGHWIKALDKYKQESVMDGSNAAMYNNLAFVYLHLGDKKDAYLSLEQALRVDPSFSQARSNLAKLGLF